MSHPEWIATKDQWPDEEDTVLAAFKSRKRLDYDIVLGRVIHDHPDDYLYWMHPPKLPKLEQP